LAKLQALFEDVGLAAGMTGTKKGATEKQLAKLLILAKRYAVTSLSHGDCIGADEQCHNLAVQKKWDIVIFPPVDPKYRAFCKTGKPDIRPKGEYLKRNKDIVNNSRLMFCFPAGNDEELRSGTWACIRYAKKVKKPHIIIFPDGHAVGFNLKLL
jgi:hypothetical protein